ncbi:hypothetical protein BJ508DRAFT_320201 [Ascobolus immersus RN42]|uniref:Uncharacterized protein n=1 Tax=Ascobolus immersus RN42 TaxID=1160509 RepID=A0A3N4IRP7_ASCIM|nr:hypothetical protein BJ508DRAFT_320201 [Ascobolus immersus RN42]
MDDPISQNPPAGVPFGPELPPSYLTPPETSTPILRLANETLDNIFRRLALPNEPEPDPDVLQSNEYKTNYRLLHYYRPPTQPVQVINGLDHRDRGRRPLALLSTVCKRFGHICSRLVWHSLTLFCKKEVWEIENTVRMNPDKARYIRYVKRQNIQYTFNKHDIRHRRALKDMVRMVRSWERDGLINEKGVVLTFRIEIYGSELHRQWIPSDWETQVYRSFGLGVNSREELNELLEKDGSKVVVGEVEWCSEFEQLGDLSRREKKPKKAARHSRGKEYRVKFWNAEYESLVPRHLQSKAEWVEQLMELGRKTRIIMDEELKERKRAAVSAVDWTPDSV